MRGRSGRGRSDKECGVNVTQTGCVRSDDPVLGDVEGTEDGRKIGHFDAGAVASTVTTISVTLSSFCFSFAGYISNWARHFNIPR